MAVSGLALALWVAAPITRLAGAALLAAGLLQAIRLGRWAGDRTLGDRLVLVLHVGYLFVPLGFGLLGAAAFGLVAASAGVHAWAAGAAGVMTLAVMSRASLGHTGRALLATHATQAIYALVVVAALARIWAALDPRGVALLHVAGAAWAAAFLGFALSYWYVLTGPRANA